jgi:hypothetical protein
MTQEEYRAAMDDVIYLVSYAVNGIKPAAERISAMDLSRVYTAAQRHLLIAAVGMALQSACIRNAQITQAMAKAQRKNALLDADRAALFARLEQENIWYMPLKGSVLKDLYPQYGMRQMADNDILIDASRAEDVKTIMESLGFTTERFGKDNHDVYHKPPVSNFEIHTALFGPSHEEKIYLYYRDVKSRLVKDKDNQCGWHFTPEDFYIYMTAHEYKHFSGGGTGLRSFLDVYVFWQKYGKELNLSYIEAETEKLGIADFEKQSRSLSLHLFGSEPLTSEDRETLDYVVTSGTYGTITHRVENKVKKLGGGTKGMIRYFFSRLVLPMNSLKTAHPFVYRHKYLIPFFTIYRLGKGLFFRWKRVYAVVKALLRMK